MTKLKKLACNIVLYCPFVVLFSICLGGVVPAAADYHALLIGVGHYPNLPNSRQLEGPAHDAEALRNILEKNYRFPARNIALLTDERATKKNIMREMNSLVNKTSPGDFIFLFFSGHGTSSNDERMMELKLSPHTGAVAPCEFDLGASVEERLATLIIGKRDIRPILQKLDKDRRVFAVFDSCFSENMYRSAVPSGMRKRYLRSKYLTCVEGLVDEEDEIGEYTSNTAVDSSYPYRNVIYLGAAHSQEAFDICGDEIKYNGLETFDGKPHGVMTDYMLRGLNGQGDLNGDGNLTYDELFHFIYSKTAVEFRQVPRYMPENDRQMLGGNVFDVKADFPSQRIRPGLLDYRKKMAIKIDGLPKTLERQIAAIGGVATTRGDYDLLAAESDGSYGLYLPNGALLASTPGHEPDAFVERIRRQVQVKDLVRLSFPDQTFNVFVDLIGQRKKLVEGDTVGFRVQSEKNARILLIDIDPAGDVNVIYPYERHELSPSKNVDLSNMGLVSPPNFGTEHVKVFAFENPRVDLERFMGESFSPSAPLFAELMALCEREKGRVAQHTLVVETFSRRDILKNRP